MKISNSILKDVKWFCLQLNLKGISSFLGILLLVILSLNQLKGETPTPTSKFSIRSDNFLTFLQQPPEIDTLVFKRILFVNPIAFDTVAEAEKFIEELKNKPPRESSQSKLYALRWRQNGDYILQTLENVSQVWSPQVRLDTFAGRSNGIWWSLKGLGALTTDSNDGIYNVDGKPNSVYLIIKKLATEILRLGMFEMDVTSIKFLSEPKVNGSSLFSATSLKGTEIKGEIFTVSNYVTKIRYELEKSEGNVKGREIKIEHVDGALNKISVSNKWKNNSVPALYCIFEVIKIDLVNSLGRVGTCDVGQFLSADDGVTLTKKNGDRYDKHGNMLKDQSQFKPNPYLNYIKFAIFALIFILILITSKRVIEKFRTK